MTRGQGAHGPGCGGCRELALMEENDRLRRLAAIYDPDDPKDKAAERAAAEDAS